MLHPPTELQHWEARLFWAEWVRLQSKQLLLRSLIGVQNIDGVTASLMNSTALNTPFSDG